MGKEHYMRIYKTKTKMVCNRHEYTRTSLIVNNYVLEKVKEFTYFGNRISKGWRSKKEIRARIIQATEEFNKKK